jgi:hypothetical protein
LVTANQFYACAMVASQLRNGRHAAQCRRRSSRTHFDCGHPRSPENTGKSNDRGHVKSYCRTCNIDRKALARPPPRPREPYDATTGTRTQRIAAVAAELYVSTRTVSRYLKEAGI